MRRGTLGDLARLAVSFLVFQRVDELDSGEEPDSEVMVSDCLHADGGGEMGLAGARSADHHDVVGVGDEVTSMQGVEQRLIGGGVENLARALLDFTTQSSFVVRSESGARLAPT